jgi:hypothetical protein
MNRSRGSLHHFALGVELEVLPEAEDSSEDVMEVGPAVALAADSQSPSSSSKAVCSDLEPNARCHWCCCSGDVALLEGY